MKPPTPLQRIAGHVIVFPLLIIGLCFLVYGWYQGTLSGWVVLGVVCVASYAAKANDAVLRHTSWKRQWDSMSDRPASRVRLGPFLRVVVGLAAWGLLAAMAIDAWDEADLRWVAATFWATNIGAVLWWLVYPRRSRSRRRAIDVQVCVKPLSRPADLRSAYGALPEYCRALLR